MLSGSAFIGGDVEGRGNSRIELRANAGIAGDLIGSEDVTAVMSGGLVGGSAIFSGNSHFQYLGGIIGNPPSNLQGLLQPVSLSGDSAEAAPGELSELLGIIARDNAIIEISGVGLTSLLVDADYQNGMFSAYRLSGHFADGSQAPNALILIQNGVGARFQLTEVPEPGGMLAAAICTLIGLARRASQVRIDLV